MRPAQKTARPTRTTQFDLILVRWSRALVRHPSLRLLLLALLVLHPTPLSTRPMSAQAMTAPPPRTSLLPHLSVPALPPTTVSARLVTPDGWSAARTFAWTLRNQGAPALPLALLALSGCWTQGEIRAATASTPHRHAIPVRVAGGTLILSHVRAADWPVTLRVTFATARTTSADGVRLTVRAGTALLLPRAARAAAVTVSLVPGPACAARGAHLVSLRKDGGPGSVSTHRPVVRHSLRPYTGRPRPGATTPPLRRADCPRIHAARRAACRRPRVHRPPTPRPAYQVRLLAPAPGHAATTFVWRLAALPHVGWPQLRSLTITGCWPVRAVRSAWVVTGSGQRLPLRRAAGMFLLADLDHSVLPITLSVTFATPLPGGPHASTAILHMRGADWHGRRGRSYSDTVLRQVVDGPLCVTPPATATITPTATSMPTSSPVSTPSASPTGTMTAGLPPAATPTPPGATMTAALPTATGTPIPAATPTQTTAPATSVPSATSDPGMPSASPSSTSTASATPTATGRPTSGATATATPSPSATATPSPSATATTNPVPPGTLPDAPGSVTAAPADRQVTVLWSIPAHDGGSPITDYKIYLSDGSFVDVGSAATSAVVGGLTNGLAYTFTVSAITLAGEGPRSAASAPAAPIALPADPSRVAPPLDTTVATSVFSASQFLYTGSAPSQTGVLSGAISVTRTAVLRGRVLDGAGAGLAGASVSILGHPEFGQTLSRADGGYDMAVDGGGLLTVAYTQTGYLPAERQVQVPWRDYTLVDDVVLLPRDPHVTVIDPAAPGVQVARGSVISDTDGTRQATLLVPPGTSAVITSTDGTTQTLAGPWHMRATEYTVGPLGHKAMPGPLPASSAYTYAADFSIDEATTAGAAGVGFSQPVPVYVQNFLGFPVGNRVPSGYYDTRRAQWVPAPDGLVIGVLGITSTNGITMADLDVGAGVPATPTVLAALGISDGERQRLAQLYAPGQSLWRVPLAHFSAWDFNWGQAPPHDATPPPPVDPAPPAPCDQCEQSGSIIRVQEQALGEAVRVAGTGVTLRYTSSRQGGNHTNNRLTIPVTGATVPPSLKRVEVEVTVAGERTFLSFPPTPNQRYSFVWDGLDAYGRPVNGRVSATVRTGYVYPLVYTQPEDRTGAAVLYQATFGHFTYYGTPVSANRSRAEITLYRTWTGPLGTWTSSATGLGGWDLNIHHSYDPDGHILYLGNGATRAQSARVSGAISTVAGNGGSGYSGDGGPATAASIGTSAVAVGPDGSLYIADAYNNRVRKVAPDGIITTVAGSGGSGYSGDGGPATAAQLHGPQSVAIGPDGSLYIADSGNRVVRKVTPDGTITTVAGAGPFFVGGYGGDGGPATAVELHPTRVAIGPDGNLYISDFYSNRIRKVTPDGIITTVAGIAGTGGYSGDGGPATAAQLNNPHGMAIAPDGSLYIAEYYSHRIRKVTPDGIITTVAGMGSPNTSGNGGYSGDGGPATAAELSYPKDVAVGPDGSLYIADSQNNRIRKVAPDGTISTVAGNGMFPLGGFSGDGGPATAASLYHPMGVAVGPNGNLYIADGGNGRVRAVAPPLPGTSVGDLFIPSEDGREIYIFDAQGRHLRTLDALTGAVRYRFGYDAAGRLASVTDLAGNVTTIQHDAAGNPTVIVAPNGQQTTLTTDTHGYLSSITDPASRTTTLTTDVGGLLQTFTDPRGASNSFRYDSLGRLTLDQEPGPNGGATALSRVDGTSAFTVTATSALSRTTVYGTVDLPDGSQQETVIDPAGGRTVTLTSPNGTQATTFPDGSVITRTLAPDPRWGMLAPLAAQGREEMPSSLALTTVRTRATTLADPANPLSLATQTDTVAIGSQTYTETYSAAARAITITTPLGRQAVTLLDTLGRPVQQTDPGRLPVQLAYDAPGRLASVTQGTRVFTLTYDSAWHLASVTDPLGQTTAYRNDAVGEPITTTLPDGQQVLATYDGNGNVTALTPPGASAHTFVETPRDLPQTYAPPAVSGLSTPTGYRYTADQQLAEVDQPDGSVVSLTYDAAGRVTGVTTPRGTTSYGYDPASGHLASVAAPDGGAMRFTHDGSLTTGISTTGAISGSLGYSYDARFRVTGETLNGSTVPYGYDGDGALTQAGGETLAYDPVTGQYTGSVLGGITDTVSYNSYGEPAAYTAMSGTTTLLSDQAARDALGRVTTLTETVGGVADTYGYGYDQRGRLTSVTRGGAITAQYGYDANGNRTSLTTATGTVTGSYDAQDRLVQYGARRYGYDATGMLQAITDTVTGAVTRTTYDTVGTLMGADLPDGTHVTYVVDGSGRRIGKKVNGTLVQGFLYGAEPGPVAETDGQGAIVSRFVYGDRGNLPAYVITGGATYRIIADGRGSPRLVVDVATGTIVQRMDYDAFGAVITDTNPGFQPFGFAGGLYDRTTGLVRFGARDYDPASGRWTAKDPLGFEAGDTNLYGYAGNDPINRIDPSGLDATDAVAGDGQAPGLVDRARAMVDKFLHDKFGSVKVGPLDISTTEPKVSLGTDVSLQKGDTVLLKGTAECSLGITPSHDPSDPLFTAKAKLGVKQPWLAKLPVIGKFFDQSAEAETDLGHPRTWLPEHIALHSNDNQFNQVEGMQFTEQ